MPLAQEGGLSGKSFTIGCSAALSGPLAGFGTDLRQGAEQPSPRSTHAAACMAVHCSPIW